MVSRRVVLGIAGVAALAVVAPALWSDLALAQAPPPVYLSKGVALSGYDPVAYFTEKKPVKGNPAIAAEHGGAKYFFASEAHRDAFKKEPAKYAPQYGGYCAYAVAQGSTAPADPTAWTVHDGKLFLNYDKSVKSLWEKDIPGNIAKGDENWPKVVKP